jgi:hypothetical protein
MSLAFSHLIPRVLERRESIYYRFHSFDHAHRALCDEIIDKYSYDEITKAVETQNMENMDSNLYKEIKNWIINDFDFYLAELEDELSGEMNYFSFEDFRKIISDDFILTMGMGGQCLSSCEWLQVFWRSDKSTSSEYLNENLIEYLTFADQVENGFIDREHAIKYMREVYEDNLEYVKRISLGAFEFKFITHECDHLNKFYGIHL